MWLNISYIWLNLYPPLLLSSIDTSILNQFTHMVKCDVNEHLHLPWTITSRYLIVALFTAALYEGLVNPITCTKRQLATSI